MDHVTMEFDGAGTFVGSAHVYAPARDYARLGQLFLDDGIGPDGQRILPEKWVEYSRRSTLYAPYGAGFWTNDGIVARFGYSPVPDFGILEDLQLIKVAIAASRPH